MAVAQTEPAAARSSDRAALEPVAFCRLLGGGDVVLGLDMLLDREAAAARRHQQQCGGAAEGGTAGCRTSARRRREQRRRQAMRTGANGTRGGHGGGGCGVGSGPKELNRASLDSQRGEADWLALGERRAHALAVFERKEFGAIEAAGAGEERYEVAETGVAQC